MPAKVRGRLQPLLAVVVRPEQPMASDVLVMRHLGQRPLQLILGKIESVVVDALPGIIKCAQKDADLAEISRKEDGLSISEGGTVGVLGVSISGRDLGVTVRHLPATKLNDHGPVRNLLGDLGRRGFQDGDLVIGQIVFIQVRYLFCVWKQALA